MHELWYDYIKPVYQSNAKLYYMDTDNFIIHIKTEELYENIAGDVEKDLINLKVNFIDHCLRK